MVRVDTGSFCEREDGQSHHDFNRFNSGPRSDTCDLLKCGFLGTAIYVAQQAMHVNEA